MSDGRVTLEAIARFDRLETAFDRQTQKVAKQEQRIESLTNKLRRMETTGLRGQNSLIANAARVAATYFSIHQAIGLVTEGLRMQSRVADEAGRQAMDAARAERSFVMATGDIPRPLFQFMRSEALRMGAREGISETDVFQTFLHAFSGTEEAPAERVPRALRMFDVMSKVAKSELVNQPNLLSAALNLEKNVFAAEGVPQEQAQEEAVALMLRFLSQSPAVEGQVALPKFAQALSAEISNARATTREERIEVAKVAAALQSATMSTIADPEGALSRTMQANLGASLREHVGRSGQDLMTALDQVWEQGLQGDITKRGRAITKGLQQDVIDKFGIINQRFLENKEAFDRPLGEAIEVLQDRMEGTRDPLSRATLAAERLKAHEMVRFRETGMALRGVSTEILERSIIPMQEARFGSAVTKGLIGWEKFFKGDFTPQQAAGRVEELLLNAVTDVAPGRAGPLSALGISDRVARRLSGLERAELVAGADISGLPFSREQRSAVEQLQLGLGELIEVLKARENQRESIDEIQKLRDAFNNGTKEWKRATDAMIQMNGGGNNQTAAGGRRNSESENP